MPNNSPVILPISEFASLLGVSTRSVYRKAENGQIPVIRVGRAIRIDRDAALAALSVPASAPEA